MSDRPKRRKSSRSGDGNFTGRLLKGVLITGSILLVLLFIGLFALKSWIENYRNSQAFRDFIAGKVAVFLKSEVQLDALKWDSGSVYADGFRARGYEDAGQSKLEIDGIRATFGGAKDGAWQVPEATANRMNIEFSKDRLQGKFGAQTDSAPPAAGAGAPDWLKGYLPSEFKIDTIRVDAANLRVLNQQAVETFSLRSVRTELKPKHGGGMEVSGQGGDLFIAQQPDLDIDRFRIRWQGTDLFVNEAEIDVYDDARISAKGIVNLTPGTPLDLDLLISNLDVKHVVGPNWEKKITGRVRGDIKLVGSVGSPEGLKQSGTLFLDDGMLTNIPVLEKIAKYTRSPRFKRLALNEATGDFERQGQRILITNIAVQSDGLSRLEGTLNIDGKMINGQFRVGVSPGTLSWIPGAERKVFNTPEKGFLWTHVNVTGTIDEPKEDLTARLIAGAVDALVEDAPQKAIDTANEIIKNPTATPGNVIDEGKKILDTLVPLLK